MRTLQTASQLAQNLKAILRKTFSYDIELLFAAKLPASDARKCGKKILCKQMTASNDLFPWHMFQRKEFVTKLHILT